MSDAPDILEHGEWRTVHGIQRWFPAPEIQARKQAAATSLLIACPKCLAKIGRACTTPCGTSTAPHASRIVARYCPCGQRLGPRARLCRPCRQQGRLETFRAYDEKRASGWARQQKRKQVAA